MPFLATESTLLDSYIARPGLAFVREENGVRLYEVPEELLHQAATDLASIGHPYVTASDAETALRDVLRLLGRTVDPAIEALRRLAQEIAGAAVAMGDLARVVQHVNHPFTFVDVPPDLRLRDLFPHWFVMGSWVRHKASGTFAQAVDAKDEVTAVLEVWEPHEHRMDWDVPWGDYVEVSPEGYLLVTHQGVSAHWEPCEEPILHPTVWEHLDEEIEEAV